ncbi:MAG: hypothetical protein CVU44_21000 [Chloroflexi bacterium HGW-Chloroflexi-6]|nr:MAG: hypothetical protein CVU44_21000 [Chloroflexi bacterium HGW-Chloroflexi-6]
MNDLRETIIERVTGIPLGEMRQENANLREQVGQLDNTLEFMQEGMAELELALEDLNYIRLSADSEQEFSRNGLDKIVDLSRLMYVKNPLIKRQVQVKSLYVWAQGINVRAKNPEINKVLQAFWDDEKNRAELTSHQARMLKEVDLQVDGNLFFVFFVRPSDGRVRVRSIPMNEIREIVCDPNDAKSPWFYLRKWKETKINPQTGRKNTTQRQAYYPGWQYNPKVKPSKFGSIEVRWNEPVYHVRIGGFSDWKFGLGEVYAGIDWARAYKGFLEDWASLTKSLSKIAWKMTTPGGKKGILAAKVKLGTTLGSPPSGAETNPAPTTGSAFIGGQGVDLQPMNIRGANVSADDGRRLLLMAAAGAGLPETYYGDVSVGTLATAKTMDRPTELMMLERQTMWIDVLRNIFNFVLMWSVKATSGALNKLGTVTELPDDDEVELKLAWNKDVKAMLDIDFPPILEHDMQAAVQAVVTALTLNGQDIRLLDEPQGTRLILNALGVDDVDEIMTEMFPDETNSVTSSEARIGVVIRKIAEALRKQHVEVNDG